MNPRLAAIAGKLKGSVFPLSDEAVVIGRETAADLCLADRAVSRRHSRVEQNCEQFWISDLQSLNGTFVNDVPVKQRALQHGDRIRIGDTQFLFLLHEGDVPSKASHIQFDDRHFVSGATVQVRFDDALFLMARDLSVLMKVSTTINAIHGLEELQKKLLELLFEAVPAECGAILLSEGEPESFGAMFGLDRAGNVDATVQVSRTIARQVLNEGVAILCNDPAGGDTPNAAESLVAARTSALLCVPLKMMQRTLGIIYLVTSEPATHFDNDHLQLVSAIAGIAAVAIENARHVESLESENELLRADARLEHNMIGESAAMRQVYAFISRAGPTDATVLISGESGTGKELAARALHQSSKRADNPFMAVNCAALAESLLESELFGHEKGAFTGALSQKKGRLEVADGGSLFLDEIGELSPALQVKLLRVLQEREFERVGGTRTIKIDIRLIAATNKDLAVAIAQGTFRQDLYYRLNVLNLEMPALRKRLEDIPLLASYFAAKYSDKCNRRVTGISLEGKERLVKYDWPGNVRELENAIERAVVLGSTELILVEDLPEAVLESEVSAGTPLTKYHEAVAETKKQIILSAMGQAQGSYTEAAKLLGVHANYLHRLIRNLNLKEQIKDK
ncbi:MAG: Response regulator of zinc sigma-54-dependent two-component system [Acidobacteria bacterium]|nr:Response regulator of zinc sigma-54-dependent two-component system [Acidobacteriota bacterium]